jgi:hypothetical protein
MMITASLFLPRYSPPRSRYCTHLKTTWNHRPRRDLARNEVHVQQRLGLRRATCCDVRRDHPPREESPYRRYNQITLSRESWILGRNRQSAAPPDHGQQAVLDHAPSPRAALPQRYDPKESATFDWEEPKLAQRQTVTGAQVCGVLQAALNREGWPSVDNDASLDSVDDTNRFKSITSTGRYPSAGRSKRSYHSAHDRAPGEVHET